MQTASSQRLAARPAAHQQRAVPGRALSAAPFRSVAVNGKQHAAAPRRQLAQQAASGGWQHWRRQRAAVEVRAEPRDFSKDRFDAANKDYAVVTQKIEETAAQVVEDLQGTSLFLVGMMGSGKSTIGKLVSQALGYCFFDTDALIEQLTKKRVSEIFAEDGEEEFRQLETQVLAELAPFKNCVVATGGGVPTRAENWGHMQGGISVWLNGPPTLLAHRVVGDGTESRPLLSQGEEQAEQQADAYQAAVARLTQLLEQRQPLYQIADLTVSLQGSGPDADIGAPAMEVCYRVLAAIAQRVKDDAEERKRRMEFEIIEGELPATMRVMESPAAARAEEDPHLP